MTKKIAILTQPLHNNYGGLLQAYALKEVLKEMGHEVTIVNRRRLEINHPRWRKYASIIKSFILRRKASPNILITHHLKEEIIKNTKQFRDKYYPELSELITDQKGMEKLNKMGFDAYVVGSDQCWRPRYSPSIRNYFLDFAEHDQNVKRISYAASFGVSNWEFTQEDTEACSRLIQKFDALSVREDSAVDLLRDYLNRDDGVHVLDPTMLLSLDKYKELVEKENVGKSPGTLKAYVLDHTPEKMSVAEKVAQQLGLKIFEVMPKGDFKAEKVTKQNISDFVYPNPAAWIRGFMDAEFVVTDSFHGTVFSILYNKPFIAIGNESRGLTRFNSLLRMFDLQDRLITDVNNFEATEFIEKKIDWDKVNNVLEREREKARDFLKESLK